MPPRRDNSVTDRPLDIPSLASAYESGLDPAEIIRELHARIGGDATQAVWITIAPLDHALAQIERAKRRREAGEALPLFGIPYAVKDNIDVAGLPTTAACPDFAYMPGRSAAVVQKLESAGAIMIGKTNLDQFATGLVGTRSPYGTPSSVFDERYIAGGSSSGSAVAVARGLVSFALGTDTAGSGRVPAAFNNIVGLKPTRGWLSTSGVTPACRSLDCVSVFAGTVEDALLVTEIAAGFDVDDPYSRRAGPAVDRTFAYESFRFGVPDSPLDFFGDADAAVLFTASVAQLERLGGIKILIDFSPFDEAASLLYGGPWIAERLAAIKDFAATSAASMHPVTREIILGARPLSAVEAFEGIHRLARLARRAEAEWARMDLMLLPTTGTTYRIDEVLADPLRLNAKLGAYTNFANLLDLSAIAVPAGFRPNGLPFGVTLFGRAFMDRDLAGIASRLHRAIGGATIGATGHPVPPAPAKPPTHSGRQQAVDIAVVGAHLSGQPLNHELLQRGARLIRAARTSRGYSLYALAKSRAARPGLVFDGQGAGRIDLEIWEMSAEAFGAFVAAIRPPLGIGTIALDDGTDVKGFLCESHAIAMAENITAFGGWRAYLKARFSFEAR